MFKDNLKNKISNVYPARYPGKGFQVGVPHASGTDTEDANALAQHILSPYTAYSKGVKRTGRISQNPLALSAAGTLLSRTDRLALLFGETTPDFTDFTELTGNIGDWPVGFGYLDPWVDGGQPKMTYYGITGTAGTVQIYVINLDTDASITKTITITEGDMATAVPAFIVAEGDAIAAVCEYITIDMGVLNDPTDDTHFYVSLAHPLDGPQYLLTVTVTDDMLVNYYFTAPGRPEEEVPLNRIFYTPFEDLTIPLTGSVNDIPKNCRFVNVQGCPGVGGTLSQLPRDLVELHLNGLPVSGNLNTLPTVKYAISLVDTEPLTGSFMPEPSLSHLMITGNHPDLDVDQMVINMLAAATEGGTLHGTLVLPAERTAVSDGAYHALVDRGWDVQCTPGGIT